ncbi:penicillin-insensitive murein endopeptidase [Hyphomicrobium methylovorum]|uniref:penicillin-insensitive murein endopeptidase n=1 Tax=Hyphomicrobium methylovorum TaxID=84 RepID=UPI0015E7524A|nr:penicillin-insensitive murein endopeptidase [Hyphomicrobium methylovorum]MBA2125517.1 penicillin-insensitive murein endopeptidase [Hyphomicrobium methylovorum]
MKAARLFASPFVLCLIGFGLVEGGGVWPVAPAFADQQKSASTPEPKPASPADTKPAAETATDASASDSSLPGFVPQNHSLSFGSEGDGSEEPDGKAASESDAKPGSSGSTQRAISIEVEPIPSETASVGKDETLPEWPEFVGAKNLFGKAKKPAPMAARAIGYYSRGCLSGAVPLPIDGPAWQEMRLSRNRNWGHPSLIALVKKLAIESQKEDGWPGLLVGDISQPRGGPMLTGHASHQVGLDADIWLTPMPNRRLSYKEREELEATSMLDKTGVAVDPKVFTGGQAALIKRAASYPEVERIFVHPAIKKALCEGAGTDRLWLSKVRPYYGHYYHFHIRTKCPPDFAGCKPQFPTTNEDGCGKEVDWWLSRVIPAKTPAVPPPVAEKPGIKLKPPKPPLMLSELPSECRALLASKPDPVTVPKAALLTHVAVKKALAQAAAARLAFAKATGLVPANAHEAAKSPALRPHIDHTVSADKNKKK